MRNRHPFTLGRLNAEAIGTGISRSIVTALDSTPNTPDQWIRFCTKAADEAHAAVLEAPPAYTPATSTADPLMKMLLSLGDAMSEDDNRQYGREVTHNADDYEAEHSTAAAPITGEALKVAAWQAAVIAFRCCMPPLTTRTNVKAYIACVAVGVQRTYFTGIEAKTLLYSAQLGLAAHRPKPGRAGRNGATRRTTPTTRNEPAS